MLLSTSEHLYCLNVVISQKQQEAVGNGSDPARSGARFIPTDFLGIRMYSTAY